MRTIATFTTLLFFFGCNSKDDSQIAPSINHIEYFGFTLVDTYWDDPTDGVPKTNYTDEVAPFSNVADILVVNPTDDIQSNIEVMNSLQMKAFLNINELFFEIDGSDALSGTNYGLRTDFRSRWDTFMTSSSLVENHKGIQAFYLGEEPTWNGISFNELQQAADYIKSNLPEIPIMLIEAYPALNDLRIPDSIDWVGFDHYFIKDPNTDTTFNAELALLKSKLTEKQKLVLVMDAHYIDFAHGDFGGIDLNEMSSVAENYYALGKRESKTIAILGYFWPSGFDNDNSIGARNMPTEVREKYKQIGKEITGK